MEVTKLSLLLKVLEEETSESISAQLSMFHERALPDLGNNIKCGNTLVGYDVDVDRNGQRRMFSDEERLNINAFDWQREFPSNFDVIIGNPPYVRQETLGDLKEYLQEHYDCYHGVADLYVYFIEKAIKLLAPGGYFSFIVANKWMRANYGEPLRRWLKTKHVEEIIDFGDLRVFKQATTYPCILRVRNLAAPAVTFKAVKMDSLDFTDLDGYVKDRFHDISVGGLDDGGWSLADEVSQKLLDKIKAVGMPLGEYVKGKIYYGIKTGYNEAFVVDGATRERLIAEDPKSAELIKPFLAGRDVKRYAEPNSDRYLIFTRRGIDIKKYPAIENYLYQFKAQLTPKPKNYKGSNWEGRKPGSYKWFEIQDTVDYYMEFEKPKIIIPCIIQSASYLYDRESYYSNDKTTILPTDDLYLVGVLNSKVPDYVMRSISSTKQGGYYEYKPMYLSQLPIRTIDFNDPADKVRHDKVVALVESMLELHKKLATATLAHDKTALQRQIDATDRQIDALVYELYGLTEEEIGIVEGKG